MTCTVRANAMAAYVVGGHILIAEGGKKGLNKAGKMTIKKESHHL